MANRNPLIGVVGSGKNSHPDLCTPLGTWLAEKGFDLVNGGGRGVMEETAKAFAEIKNRKGKVIGILPSSEHCRTPVQRAAYESLPGYPNAFTEIVIRTHLPWVGAEGKETESRNHIIVLSSDLIIALPGSEGTRTEIELAIEYGKPLILISPNGEWDEFASQAVVVKTVQAAVNRLKKWVREE
jgi:predicted Rossmann-fold nucleotide-binding protein